MSPGNRPSLIGSLPAKFTSRPAATRIAPKVISMRPRGILSVWHRGAPTWLKSLAEGRLSDRRINTVEADVGGACRNKAPAEADFPAPGTRSGQHGAGFLLVDSQIAGG